MGNMFSAAGKVSKEAFKAIRTSLSNAHQSAEHIDAIPGELSHDKIYIIL